MPMVTFFKSLNVSRLIKISRKSKLKFNMLMCYCIGKAASGIKEFYLLPVGGKLLQYDSIAVNDCCKQRWQKSVRVIYLSLMIYHSLIKEYQVQQKQVSESYVNHDLTQSMVIGTLH